MENERLLEDIVEEYAIDDGVEIPVDPKSDAEIENAYVKRSFRVVYQNHNFFLPQLQGLINGREVVNLRPEYQRRFRWNRTQKSQLIESLLLNIPVPPIYLFESQAARYEVMDGQQRLNAVYEYMSNDFALYGLEELSFINGRRHSKLPPALIRGLERASLSAVVLLQETRSDHIDPFVVRRYVFERLNTGGQKLNPQEIRNSIYRGKFNNLIVNLARNTDFCKIFGIPVYTETDENEFYESPIRQQNNLYKSMADCQIVLRFFAFEKDIEIRGSVKSMLDRAMDRHLSDNEADLSRSRKSFEECISAARAIFDADAFVIPAEGKQGARLSIAVYDAVMTALNRKRALLPRLLQEAAKTRHEVNLAIAENRHLMTGRANTAQSIKDRISAVIAALERV